MHLVFTGSSSWAGYPVAIYKSMTPRAKVSAEAEDYKNLTFTSLLLGDLDLLVHCLENRLRDIK